MKALLLTACTLLTFSGLNMLQKEQEAANGSLIIRLTGLRNHKGLIRIGLYSDPGEFTDNPSRSYTFKKDTLSSSTMTCRINGIPEGTYAISILDDEDGDNKMDYRLVIWPDEGFGFSNNPMISRPVKPKYSDISFDYNGANMVVEIVIAYF